MRKLHFVTDEPLKSHAVQPLPAMLSVQNSEEDVASSLLGTPYLATQASHGRAPNTTPKRLPPTPQKQDEQEVSCASPFCI